MGVIYIYYIIYIYYLYIYIPELNRGLFMRPAALAASVYTISLYLCYKSATNNPPLLLYKDIESICIYIYTLYICIRIYIYMYIL